MKKLDKINNNTIIDEDSILVDVDECFKESELTGHFHQIAKDTIEKELARLCDKYNIQSSLYSFELNLKFLCLNSNLNGILRMIEVSSKDIIK